MRNPKPRLARNIHFEQVERWSIKTGQYGPATKFELNFNGRVLMGEVGQRLQDLGGMGKITFLDETPRNTNGHLFVLGLSHGVLVVLLADNGTEVYTERVDMCATFQDKIVGGAGKLRWAKVKVVA